MATLPIVTAAQAVDAVKGALGLIDDGVSDPVLDAHILSQLNRAQRHLRETQALFPLRRSMTLASIAGVRLFDLPEDCAYGQIKAIRHVATDGTMTELMAGLDRTRRVDDTGIPERYDLVPSRGVVALTLPSGDGIDLTLSGGARDAYGIDPSFTISYTDGLVSGVTLDQTGTGWTSAPVLQKPIIDLTPQAYSSGDSVVFTDDLGTITLEYRGTPSGTGPSASKALEIVLGNEPAANDYVTLRDGVSSPIKFLFYTGTPTPATDQVDVEVGATPLETAQNLEAAINACIDLNLVAAYDTDTHLLNIWVITPGTDGNSARADFSASFWTPFMFGAEAFTGGEAPSPAITSGAIGVTKQPTGAAANAVFYKSMVAAGRLVTLSTDGLSVRMPYRGSLDITQGAVVFQVDYVGTAATATLGPVQALEIQPIASDGSFLIEYEAGVTELVNESDPLAFDLEAVIGLAAWYVALVRKPALATSLLAAHNAYLSAHVMRQRPAQILSLRRNFPPSSYDPFTRYRTWPR